MPNPHRSRHPWRNFAILALAACGLLMATASLASAANAIQTENALPGTTGWRHTNGHRGQGRQRLANLQIRAGRGLDGEHGHQHEAESQPGRKNGTGSAKFRQPLHIGKSPAFAPGPGRR